jgi:hypothetical protein
LSLQIKKWNVGHPFWKSLSYLSIARLPIGANQTFRLSRWEYDKSPIAGSKLRPGGLSESIS